MKKIDMRKASKRERKAAEQEAQLLSTMKHPNIVAYKESFEAVDGFLYIVMGFCEGGDLYSKLKEQKGVLLEERQVVEWFVQIAMALQVHEVSVFLCCGVTYVIFNLSDLNTSPVFGILICICV